jgi:hypothetical protein
MAGFGGSTGSEGKRAASSSSSDWHYAAPFESGFVCYAPEGLRESGGVNAAP